MTCILIFGEASRASLISMKETLDIYSNLTGSHSNHSKSVVVYSKFCKQIPALEAIIQIPTKSFPIKSRVESNYWQPGSSSIRIVERIITGESVGQVKREEAFL